MKKQKTVYRCSRYEGKILYAKKEVSFELKLSSRLFLDELCFNWNKKKLKASINNAIDTGDREAFNKLSKEYKHFIWE